MKPVEDTGTFQKVLMMLTGGSVYKFKTLEHNGVLFPAEFEPHQRTLSNEILSPLAEEMLYAYTTKLETDYVKRSSFNKNFFKCLKSELSLTQSKLKFPDDYTDTFEQLKKDIQAHKEFMERTKEERRCQAEKLKEIYGFAYIDGKKQPLGNFIVEPPGIYIGRGNSPLIGLWKYRTEPEDVVLNYVGPNPPETRCRIEHNRKVLYVAYYNINIGNVTTKRKEVRFGNKSDVIADRDKLKFKKSKKLLDNWNKVQDAILSDLVKGSEEALIAWLIQFTSIRIGTERDETESDEVVGASTLKVSNLEILSDTSFKLDFVGKDSVKFSQTYSDISPEIITALKRLLDGKSSNESVFNVDAKDVNAYLNNLLPGLTAKVFRTAWASKLLIEHFKGLRKLDINQLKEILLEVSKKLNHKKAVSDSAKAALKKISDKIKELEDKLKTATPKRKKSIRAKIKELKQKLKFKKDSLDINLNTALTNYINPVLVFEICKRFDIDVSKIYSKALLERFSWVVEMFSESMTSVQ